MSSILIPKQFQAVQVEVEVEIAADVYLELCLTPKLYGFLDISLMSMLIASYSVEKQKCNIFFPI